MMTGSSNGGFAYILTSVPQMPATSTLSRAASSDSSGIGSSLSSVVLGATRTAARTLSAICLLRGHYGIMVMPIYQHVVATTRDGERRMSEPVLTTVTRTSGAN